MNYSIKDLCAGLSNYRITIPGNYKESDPAYSDPSKREGYIIRAGSAIEAGRIFLVSSGKLFVSIDVHECSPDHRESDGPIVNQ